MKKVLLSFLISTSAFLAQAQENKESIVYLNGGGYIGSHNNIGAYMGLEYDRQLKGNWCWGARLGGTYYLGNPISYDAEPGQNPYRNTLDQNIYKADAMIYYRIPVIKDIVKLRAGAGLGLGYHNIFDKKYTEKDKVIPYLNASLNWIVKCGKHLEFVFSPAIIICPSEFDWSFIQLGGNTDINPWLTNFYGLSFGIGYRF
ncbi:MAG: hypothetical protein II081_05735 [Prevotella sp.]|nr:hypothetical protein [Prevotella sp.]